MKGKWHYILLIAVFSIWNQFLWGWLGLGAFLIFYYMRYKEKPGSWLFFFISSIVLIYFSLLPSFESAIWEDDSPQDHSTIQGMITSNPEIKEDYISFTLNENHTNEKIMVNVNSGQTNSNHVLSFQHGGNCKVTGRLQLPRQARNPGAFDYRSYLKAMGIYVQMNVDQSEIQCEGRDWLAYSFQVKDNLLQHLEERYRPVTYHWIQALIFGDKDLLSEEMIQEFQNWNLSHLLAISGLHVGLIIFFFYSFLNRFCKISIEKSKYILMIFLPVYALFANGNPPVLRAVLMAEVLFIFSIMGRRWPLTDVVSMTALLLLLHNPLLLYQLGFQFSFIVTFALILSKGILSRLPSFFWSSIYISFISQLAIIPLQLWNFYYISPLSLFANLFFVPYFSAIVIPLSLLAVLFSWLPPIFTAPIDFYFTRLHEPLLFSIFHYVKDAQLLWIIGKISLITVMSYYVGLFMFMKLLENNRRKRALITSSFLVMLLIAEQLAPYLDNKGTVTVLDVGQGDTFIIELPNRKGIMMIDAAKEMSLNNKDEKMNPTAEYAIKPFLWSRGITTIDHLVITHFDQDHFGSYPYLVENFQIQHLYTNPAYKEFLSPKAYSKHTVLTSDMNLNIGKYSFHVLYPHKQGNSELNQNQQSIVLYTEFGGRTFLFTGDIGSEGERKMLEKYPSLQADILKVGHHGSKYSTSDSFLQSLQPEYAIISVGEHNLYGHPSPETIKRLQQQQVQILRTDLNGAIQYRFAKNSGTFLTMFP
ncbi:DNA internalization-related competence protein ComEC/Rec2 [Salinibacillus kushneri]|uniref:DNA internalization-related competence protein ComEC/Rec2 n=1 Tax=Salinibacillus kushneri TaxID=237682 RepID=UPI0015A54937|nr:DNA internalization-related competence protein ComEC/Rec2 [Salinibacillus kushneri]